MKLERKKDFSEKPISGTFEKVIREGVRKMSEIGTESVGKTSDVGEEDLNFIASAQRVFAELGSRKDCTMLLDQTPKLMQEKVYNMRLHKPDAKLKKCKVYLFDKVLIVGSQRLRRKDNGDNVVAANEASQGVTTETSSDNSPVWFGSKNNSSDSGAPSVAKMSDQGEEDEEGFDSEDSDYDVYGFGEQLKALELEERAKKKAERRYNLKMWIDLSRVKVKCKILSEENLLGIMITYVGKVQVEIRPREFVYETVVDQAELWLENSEESKTLFGIIGETVKKNAAEQLMQMAIQQRSRGRKSTFGKSQFSELKTTTDSLSESASENSQDYATKNSRKSNSPSNKLSETSVSTSGSTSTSRRKKNRARLKKGKQVMQATMRAQQAGILNKNSSMFEDVLQVSDLEEKKKMRAGLLYPEPDALDEEKTAEYTVNFKGNNLGFSLSSGKNLGPFVRSLINGGQAQYCGVAAGDRVIEVNEHEIKEDDGWKDCVALIKKCQAEGPLRITFSRKRDAENKKRQKEKREQEIVEELKKAEENGIDINDKDEFAGIVEPVMVDDEEKLEEPTGPLARAKTMELVRKSTKGNYAKFTMRKGRKSSGKRRRKFADKIAMFKQVDASITSGKELKEFRKDKHKILERQRNIDDLFATVLGEGYLTSKKAKACVLSLQEIYMTEEKYTTDLNSLRRFHLKLSSKRKAVPCKELKNGKSWCEHMRPQRMCKRISSYRQRAVDAKDLDAIFLNVKSIVRFNQYLFKQLQLSLDGHFQELKKGIKVPVHEIMQTFCKKFARLAPFLQMYWQYCQRYTKACEKMKVLNVKNEVFRKVVSDIQKQYKVNMLRLLIRPVQRLTKYHLLFSGLQSYAEKYLKEVTEEKADSETVEAIQESVQKLKNVAEALFKTTQKVQLKVGEAENLQAMVEAHAEIGGDRVGGCRHLLQPHRRFKGKQEVHYKNFVKDELENSAMLYLFNDMFAVCVAKTERKKSKFLNRLPRMGIKLSMGSKSGSAKRKTPKKLSIGSGSVPSTAKESTRLSYGRTRQKTDPNAKRNSYSSVDSKNGAKEVMLLLNRAYWKNIGKLGKRDEVSKQDDGTDVTFYGVEAYYYRNLDDGETESTQFVFFVTDESERDTLLETMENLKKEDKEKRDKIEEQKLKGGAKPKRKRKFAKKRDKFKKQSLANGLSAKSSMYSGQSVGAMKEV